MPSERQGPGSPVDWLRHAWSDISLARVRPSPDVMLEALCFHAQQAAEKAIKAILISRDIPVPRTHNLRSLLDRLPRDLSTPGDVSDAVSLTDYAVSASPYRTHRA